MKEQNFSESRFTTNNAYILIVGLFLLCTIFGYTTWQQKHLTKDIPPINFTKADISITNIEEDLSNSLQKKYEFIISDGDTLGSIFNEADINNNDASALIKAFATKFNPRKLNIGTVIAFNFKKQNFENSMLKGMTVTIHNNLKIEVSRDENNIFSAVEILVPLTRQVEHKSGIIKNNFTAAAIELTIPSNAVMGMIRAFSYDIDFQRDIKHGDKLEVIMDKFYTEEGKLSHTGDVLYSSITLKNKKISIYLHVNEAGQSAYYNEKGENIKKEFLRTPINAARISSKFGLRNHPVLGYTRMHKGVDFAAPMGTPILAAGSGVVESATRLGQYGKYIKIKHNATYSTAYAHASRFAKGIKPGYKVTQGQVIAYVGKTGVTSGPHLHYEVIENGKQINPLKFKFASSSGKLTGKELIKFKKTKKKIEQQLISL